MSQTIDSLQIEIDHNSKEVSKSIERLTSSLSRLKSISKGSAGLTSTANQLKKLSSALNEIKNPESSIKGLVKALEPLQDVKKSNINSSVNALRKIPKISKELSQMNLKSFEKQMRRAAKAIRPLADEMNKVARGFQAFPSRIRKIIEQNEKLNTSVKKTNRRFGVLGTGLSQLQFKLMSIMYVLRMSGRVIAETFGESNKYIENLNLFTVSMGKYAKESLKYAETVQKALGIDMSEWIRNQGIFMQIATGFGVVDEKAQIMSKGLTQIAYDISSFFNLPIEEALLKVQSGISGELEPLRRLGYALDMATLQQVAYSEGITKNINKMTQAEKSQLRYIAILKQSGNVMGDMSRTILTPANSVRILKQQFTQLRRALGNVVSVVAVKIIPIIRALVEVVKEAANALADFFGFELPEIDYSSLKGLKSGAEEGEKALDGATKAAKKLKSVTTGFDELNIISPQTPTGGGAGDLSGGGDFNAKLNDYNFLGELSDESNEKMEKLKKKFKEILKLALKIGTAMLGWKAGKGIGKIASSFGAFPAILNTDSKGVKGFLGNLKKFKGLAAMGPELAGLGAAFGVVLVHMDNMARGNKKYKKGLDVIYEGLRSLATLDLSGILEQLKKIGLNLPDLSKIAEATGKPELANPIYAIGALHQKLGGRVFQGLTSGGLGSLGAMASQFKIFDDIILKIGEVSSTPVDEIDLFKGLSKKSKEELEPVTKQIRALDDAIADLKMKSGAKVKLTDGDVEKVKTANSNLSAMITDKIKDKKTGVRDKFSTLKGQMSESEYAKLISETESYYDSNILKIQEGEQQINEILNQAMEERGYLTQEQMTAINNIQQEMQKTGIQQFSQSEIEYKTIMTNLKESAEGISLEQASSIIQNAKKTKDETIKAAQEEYSTILLEAEKMHETGQISDETYNNMITAAKKTKDETVRSAEEQFSNIQTEVKKHYGGIDTYLDTETGKMKTTLEVQWDNIKTALSGKWKEIKEDFTTTWDTTKKYFKGIYDDVMGWIEDMWTNIKKIWEKKKDDKNDRDGKKGDIHAGGSQNVGGRNRIYGYATGGFPDKGEMFIAREQGPELVGSIGSKTAVANNNQIIQGIYEGVKTAVSQALVGKEDGGNPITNVKVMIDSEEIAARIEKIKEHRGVQIYNGGVLNEF